MVHVPGFLVNRIGMALIALSFAMDKLRVQYFLKDCLISLLL